MRKKKPLPDQAKPFLWPFLGRATEAHNGKEKRKAHEGLSWVLWLEERLR